jgi:23S rRNA (adenine2503-C2)-methyltransferase
MRAQQVWNWIYQRGVTEIAQMANISKDTRHLLDQHFVVGRPEVVSAQVSTDGTRKWLLRFDDGEEAECVFIPDAYRGTLCVSSQVGCTLNCRFCFTGTMKLVRNLTPAEIVGQVMLARDALGEWPSATGPALPALPETDDSPDDEDEDAPYIPGAHNPGANYTTQGRMLTNIVMMGMGEPLYNFDNVRDALQIVMDGEGLGLSRRRITLSTSGVVPMMARAGDEIGVNLAVSLHATSKEIRDEIVPINKKYGIEELLAACAAYPGASNARRITFEYVMLKDKNDHDEHARELVRLIRKYKLPAKVNLIPFNPWPGSAYETSTDAQVRRFSNIIFEAGISAPVRRPRGRDIMAACGQLKSSSEKITRAELDRRAAEKEAEWVD